MFLTEEQYKYEGSARMYTVQTISSLRKINAVWRETHLTVHFGFEWTMTSFDFEFYSIFTGMNCPAFQMPRRRGQDVDCTKKVVVLNTNSMVWMAISGAAKIFRVGWGGGGLTF